jgi:hypothetical protein
MHGFAVLTNTHVMKHLQMCQAAWEECEQVWEKMRGTDWGRHAGQVGWGLLQDYRIRFNMIIKCLVRRTCCKKLFEPTGAGLKCDCVAPLSCILMLSCRASAGGCEDLVFALRGMEEHGALSKYWPCPSLAKQHELSAQEREKNREACLVNITL